MINAVTLGRRRTLSVTAAYVIAAMLYLGASLLAIGLLTCPRPYRRSRLRDEPEPAPTPQLDAVIATIAHALGVDQPDRILFDLRFNASWGHDGWRRQRVLRLGVPLLAALDTEPTLALLAHELAHERNGDAR